MSMLQNFNVPNFKVQNFKVQNSDIPGIFNVPEFQSSRDFNVTNFNARIFNVQNLLDFRIFDAGIPTPKIRAQIPTSKNPLIPQLHLAESPNLLPHLSE